MTVVAVACRRWRSMPDSAGTAFGVLADYVGALAAVGAAAVLVPLQAYGLAASVLDRCDGLLLPGGEDVTGGSASESPEEGGCSTDSARDEFELLLFSQARSRGVPVLGICRGLHILNVASGGTVSHLSYAVPSPLRHITKWRNGEVYVHNVSLVHGSFLASLWGDAKPIRVNGVHRYCVKTVGRGLRASAHSADGAIEALEATHGAFCVGVQWHPERLVSYDDHHAVALFRAFVAACSGIAQRRPSGAEAPLTGTEV